MLLVTSPVSSINIVNCGTAMLNTKPEKTALSQLDKFKQAARELEVDEDEARWDERLKKVVKANPKDKPE